MNTVSRLLTTTEVQALTGWSILKVRALIKTGRLRAVDTSTGSRPFWQVMESDLAAFLNRSSVVVEPPKKITRRRTRIDANVEQVFGVAK